MLYDYNNNSNDKQVKETVETWSQTSFFSATLFHVWEGGRVWVGGNYSLDMHLNYLGPVTCFSPF